MRHHSRKIPPTAYSTVAIMAITNTNKTKRSRRCRRADRSNKLSALQLAIVLMAFHQSTQILSCSAFSPLFTASSSPATRSAKKQYAFSGLSMPVNKKTEKKSKKKSKNKDEETSRWMSWLSKGSLSKSRHADEVRMREAEELGGVPRSDRYSSW